MNTLYNQETIDFDHISKGFFYCHSNRSKFRLMEEDRNHDELASDRFIPLRRGDLTKSGFDTCFSKDSNFDESNNSSLKDKKKSGRIFKEIQRDNVLTNNLGYDCTGQRKANYFDNSKQNYQNIDDTEKEISNNNYNNHWNPRKLNHMLHYRQGILKPQAFNSEEVYLGLCRSKISTIVQKFSDKPKNFKNETNNSLKGINSNNNFGISYRYEYDSQSKSPYKTQEAPGLEEDFYLNLLDWSFNNQICISLEGVVYMWDFLTKQVDQVCDMPGTCSVKFSGKGENLALGSNEGNVEIWNISEEKKKSQDFQPHSSRVGTIKWLDDHNILSGSRDGVLVHSDLRIGEVVNRYFGHSQEICGLSICDNDQNKIATGGNDNKLILWDIRTNNPTQVLKQHKAAIKAVAWDPNERGIIYSGGGNRDKTIKSYNSQTSAMVRTLNVDAQVTGQIFSKFDSLFVSCHGYVTNHLALWKVPNNEPILKLKGHDSRILYYAQSPDGEDIVTGAGDESIKFWKVFKRNGYKNLYSLLPNSLEIR